MYQLRAISPNLLHAKVTHYMIYTVNSLYLHVYMYVCIDMLSTWSSCMHDMQAHYTIVILHSNNSLHMLKYHMLMLECDW